MENFSSKRALYQVQQAGAGKCLPQSTVVFEQSSDVYSVEYTDSSADTHRLACGAEDETEDVNNYAGTETRRRTSAFTGPIGGSWAGGGGTKCECWGLG
jgi:hypothetical protein